MTRRTPPLQAVEAFLFAARATSFRHAAEQMALSPSAFSRRIKSLEDFLGAVLFVRGQHAPQLTDAGVRYLTEIAPAIEAIRAASAALCEDRADRHLRLMAPHSFAITWLMPRLPAFLERHGDIEVDIIISRDLGMLRSGRADLAIVSGPREMDKLPSQLLMNMSGMLVSAPSLVGGRRPPRSLDELRQHRLLGVEIPPDLWPRWLENLGSEGLQLPEPQKFETLSLMYEAAANGLGVTIALPAVSDAYFREGRLEPCFSSSAPLEWNYSLAWSNPRVRRRAAAQCMAAWIESEIAGSLATFAAAARPAADHTASTN